MPISLDVIPTADMSAKPTSREWARYMAAVPNRVVVHMTDDKSGKHCVETLGGKLVMTFGEMRALASIMRSLFP